MKKLFMFFKVILGFTILITISCNQNVMNKSVHINVEFDYSAALKEMVKHGAADNDLEQVFITSDKEMQQGSKDYFACFINNYTKICIPNGKQLEMYFPELSKEKNDEQNIQLLKQNLESGIEQVKTNIMKRIKNYGGTVGEIKLIGNNRLEFDVKNIDNPDSVKKMLTSFQNFKIMLVKNDEEVPKVFSKIDKLLSGVDYSKYDDSNDSRSSIINKYKLEHPFTLNFATYFEVPDEGDNFKDSFYDPSLYLDDLNSSKTLLPSNKVMQFEFVDYDFKSSKYFCRIESNNCKNVSEIFNKDNIRKIIPSDWKILFSKIENTQAKNKVQNLYVLTKTLPIINDNIQKITKDFDSNQMAIVKIDLDSKTANYISDFTESNIGNRIAFIFDDNVACARIIGKKISGKTLKITFINNFEAEEFEHALKAGAYKIPIKIVN